MYVSRLWQLGIIMLLLGKMLWSLLTVFIKWYSLSIVEPGYRTHPSNDLTIQLWNKLMQLKTIAIIWGPKIMHKMSWTHCKMIRIKPYVKFTCSLRLYINILPAAYEPLKPYLQKLTSWVVHLGWVIFFVPPESAIKWTDF